MHKLKIVITGGHLSPALAVIEELEKRGKAELYYIGRKFALEGDKAESLEYITIKKSHIPFIEFSAGRLQRTFTIHTFASLFKVPFSIYSGLQILNEINPDLVLSFGGYVALPICLAAYLKHIPVFTHEQTCVLGLSNRIISRIARVVCLSWRDTKYSGDSSKFIITGNPIRNDFLKYSRDRLWNFGDRKLPLVYITGGSLGSKSINLFIMKNLPELLREFRLIHQCGNADKGYDFDKLKGIKSRLGKTGGNYKVVMSIDPSCIGNLMKKADLVIGRSGANTVTELIYLHKRAILIPLPWSADNEQQLNAEMAQNTGLGRIIRQNEMEKADLIGIIHEELGKNKIIKADLENESAKYNKNPASLIADLLYRI